MVTTSDTSNAGTDANVFFCLYGNKGKSDDVPLENRSDTFERGETDEFKVETADVGKPYKLRVWHDNAGRGPGWHLDKVRDSTETRITLSLAGYQDDKSRCLKGAIRTNLTLVGRGSRSEVHGARIWDPCGG